MSFRATEHILLDKLFLGLENLTTKASGSTNKANVSQINQRSMEKIHGFGFYLVHLPYLVYCLFLGP